MFCSSAPCRRTAASMLLFGHTAFRDFGRCMFRLLVRNKTHSFCALASRSGLGSSTCCVRFAASGGFARR